MFRIYTAVNLLLLILAVVITLWLVPDAPRAVIPDVGAVDSLSGGAVGPDSDATSENGRVDFGTTMTAAGSQVPGEVDVLWEDNLFSASRGEGMAVDAAADGAVVGGGLELELVAIGRIGSEAAAVILHRAGSVRRGTAGDGVRKTRHVYRQGESINNTGFEIAEIRLREVTLVKGDEQRVLRLSADDAGSRARIGAVTADGGAERAGGDAAGTGETPPPPPGATELPRPGARAPSGTGQDGEVSREERIQQALQRRREYIERLRRQRTEGLEDER